MSFSNILEEKGLNQLFKGTATNLGGTKYLALYTAAPSDTGGGTEVPSTYDYERQPITFGNAATVDGAMTISNSIDIVFDAANGGAWNAITHIGVFDASTGGNFLAWSALSASKTVSDRDIFKVPATELSITLD